MSARQPIEIVGGGLAGLSLGIALRRHGIDTTVIDAGGYPRHRVCGEFITGLPRRTIQRLQLETVLRDARRNSDVTWFANGDAIRRQRLPSPALSLSRYLLDARLAETFVAAGGELVTNTRVAKPDGAGRVFATGRRRADSTWLGLKLHARGLSLRDDLELHLGDHAYVGLVRVEDDRVNVCGLFDRDAGASSQALDERRRSGFIPDMSGVKPDLRTETSSSNSRSEILLRYLRRSGLDQLARRVAAADIDENSFCAVAALKFDRRVSDDAELRLGDACATIAPFTGHGMAMAFQSAEIALDPLVEYANGRLEWTRAQRQIRTQLQRRFRLRLMASGGLHSFLFAPRRQRWLALLNRAHLLPLRPIYSALH
jgi:flavin-dependent dehydrogenase